MEYTPGNDAHAVTSIKAAGGPPAVDTNEANVTPDQIIMRNSIGTSEPAAYAHVHTSRLPIDLSRRSRRPAVAIANGVAAARETPSQNTDMSQ